MILKMRRKATHILLAVALSLLLASTTATTYAGVCHSTGTVGVC